MVPGAGLAVTSRVHESRPGLAAPRAPRAAEGCVHRHRGGGFVAAFVFKNHFFCLWKADI